MPRRKPSRSEPACSRCKNEVDLVQWHDGKVYCPGCLDCGCEYRTDHDTTNDICVGCLRQLYTLITFEGPRIQNIEVYGMDGFDDYGVRAYELLVWTHDEEELLESIWSDERCNALDHKPTIAPPHHRFTSWGGNR